VKRSSHGSRVFVEGHLIDTGLLSRCFGVVIEGGGSYQVRSMEVGRTKREYSRAELAVDAPDPRSLQRIIANLSALGCRMVDEAPVRFQKCPRDGVAPDEFYASTHHHTEILHDGKWITVAEQRMDGVIVVKGRRARCVLIRNLKRGDLVVCGVDGVRNSQPFEERKAESFAFMKSEASSERAVVVKAREVARLARAAKAAGRKVVFVPGPVVVHTGGTDSFRNLVRRGWVDGVLSGNALAVHDVERALYGTSLGVDVERGIPTAEGHMHHLRAINTIRREGSLANAVRRRVLKDGIMYELIRAEVPFVLAGSIRDDGPLPDTEMDLIVAQQRYAEVLEGAGLVIVLASMLHGIGVGNMTRSDVPIVCVDIHSSVVTKLSDRGSAQAIGIVTDVSAFLHRLDRELRGKPGSK
jgi:lysine-ketoglutarate reductase/saccharopine dehydrogenase-like protein (TIGR00300 family)